jgi:hypothetical protein
MIKHPCPRWTAWAFTVLPPGQCGGANHALATALGAGLLTPPIQGPITEWPEQVIGRESPVRGEYLQAIRGADEGDYVPLFELHRRFTASG